MFRLEGRWIIGWNEWIGDDDCSVGCLEKKDGYYFFEPAKDIVLCVGELKAIMNIVADKNKNL